MLRFLQSFFSRQREDGPIPAASSHWHKPESYMSSWSQRAAAIAPFLSGYAAICDIGCGPKHILRAFIPAGATYLPADLVAWTEETEVCDLNDGRYPVRSLQQATCCVMLGVVERLENMPAMFEEIAKYCEGFVFSYHPKDKHPRAGRWGNHLREDELLANLCAAGMQIVDRRPYRKGEVLYHAKPVAKWSGTSSP